MLDLGNQWTLWISATKNSDAKLLEGILAHPKIQKLMVDKMFELLLPNETELNVWNSYKADVDSFFGKSSELSRNYNKKTSCLTIQTLWLVFYY